MSAGATLSGKKRDALRAAWFGPMPALAIAKRARVSAILVRKFWESERAAGRLPAHPAPRPHFAQCQAIAEDDDPDLVGEDFTASDAPIGGPMGLKIPAGDPLLCALRLVHGAEPWRRLDGMPSQTLQMENDTPPSKARVVELAATRDFYVAALMARAQAGAHSIQHRGGRC